MMRAEISEARRKKLPVIRKAAMRKWPAPARHLT
jgi:hypothetical protein